MKEDFWTLSDGRPRHAAGEIGTTRIVFPGAEAGSRGQPNKLLNPSGPDHLATTVTLHIRSEYAITEPVVAGGVVPGGVPGLELIGRPLVALVQWGVAGAYQRIEFDIPPPRIPSIIYPLGAEGAKSVTDIGAGVTVTLSGSSFQVEARNDGNIAWLVAPATSVAGNAQPAKIMAFISPAQSLSGTGPLCRTVHIAGSSAAGVPFVFAAGAETRLSIPPFAKSVRLARNPSDVPMIVQFMRADPLLLDGEYFVAINDHTPILLPPGTMNLRIANLGAIDIDWLSAVFEVNPS